METHPGPRVLFIDDIPIIGEGIRRMLASESDIAFEYCQHASEAAALAREFCPTVVLQDLEMPEIDGLTQVGVFRQDEELRNIPIIIVSSK
ncbi:MAG: response regulator [Planctomycetales bacterium]